MDSTLSWPQLIVVDRQSTVTVFKQRIHVEGVIERESGDGGPDDQVPPLDMYIVVTDL